MPKFVLLFLFIAPFAFAVSNDASCTEFCNMCTEEQSEVCTKIVATCGCNVSTEETEVARETVEEPLTTPIMNVPFGPPQENKDENSGAIMEVNFGNKGDSEYTAKLKDDGSYELKEKNNTGMWVAIGAGVLLTITIVILAAL